MCSFQSVLGLLVEGIARGFNTFRMSVVAERANVAPGDRQPAAHETLNAFCAKGCVAALADCMLQFTPCDAEVSSPSASPTKH